MIDNLYKTMIQNINISIDDVGVPELGKIGPYYRYCNFPVELTIPIKLHNGVDGFFLDKDGELVLSYSKEGKHPYFYGLKIIRGL